MCLAVVIVVVIVVDIVFVVAVVVVDVVLIVLLFSTQFNPPSLLHQLQCLPQPTMQAQHLKEQVLHSYGLWVSKHLFCSACHFGGFIFHQLVKCFNTHKSLSRMAILRCIPVDFVLIINISIYLYAPV